MYQFEVRKHDFASKFVTDAATNLHVATRSLIPSGTME
jgi:hypothetical protein